MASAGSSLIKAVLVVLFIGAVFFGVNFLLEEVPEPSPAPTAPSAATTQDEEVIEDPEVAEARQIGSNIGRRVGEEVGRRVGELLVAKLEAGGFPQERDTAGAAPDEDSDAGMSTVTEPAPSEDEQTADSEADSDMEEPPTGTEVAAADDTESAPSDDEPTGADPMVAQAEEETPAEPASPPAPATTDQADKPAKTRTTLPEPPEVNRWWNKSANGNGLRVIYVGQSVTKDDRKGISVIFSDALADGQNLNNLIQVNDAGGQSLDGNWRIAPHAKSIFFSVPGAGRYRMSFEPSLEDVNGHTLGTSISGPVKVR